VLGVMGYLFGLFILIGWSGIPLYESFESMIHQSPEAALWCLLITAQVGMWFVLTASLAQMLRPYRNVMSVRWRPFLGVILAIVAMFSTFLLSRQYPDDFSPIVANQMPKIGFLTLLGFVPFIASLSGLYLVGAAAEQRIGMETEFDTEAQALMHLREDLDSFLGSAGLIIGAATLATGVLQQAVHSLHPAYAPNTLNAVIYGGFGTGIIALLYVPAHRSLQAAGARLCTKVLPLPRDVNGIATWQDTRTKLDGLLGLER
jgi:hypothetical protein